MGSLLWPQTKPTVMAPDLLAPDGANLAVLLAEGLLDHLRQTFASLAEEPDGRLQHGILVVGVTFGSAGLSGVCARTRRTTGPAGLRGWDGDVGWDAA